MVWICKARELVLSLACSPAFPLSTLILVIQHLIRGTMLGFHSWGPSPKSPSTACVAVGDVFIACLGVCSFFTVSLPSAGSLLGASFGLLIYTLVASCPILEWFPRCWRGKGRLTQDDKPFVVLINDQISISVQSKWNKFYLELDANWIDLLLCGRQRKKRKENKAKTNPCWSHLHNHQAFFLLW